MALLPVGANLGVTDLERSREAARFHAPLWLTFLDVASFRLIGTDRHGFLVSEVVRSNGRVPRLGRLTSPESSLQALGGRSEPARAARLYWNRHRPTFNRRSAIGRAIFALNQRERVYRTGKERSTKSDVAVDAVHQGGLAIDRTRLSTPTKFPETVG